MYETMNIFSKNFIPFIDEREFASMEELEERFVEKWGVLPIWQNWQNCRKKGLCHGADNQELQQFMYEVMLFGGPILTKRSNEGIGYNPAPTGFVTYNDDTLVGEILKGKKSEYSTPLERVLVKDPRWQYRLGLPTQKHEYGFCLLPEKELAGDVPLLVKGRMHHHFFGEFSPKIVTKWSAFGKFFGNIFVAGEKFRRNYHGWQDD